MDPVIVGKTSSGGDMSGINAEKEGGRRRSRRASLKGGMLMGNMPPMGGRRRRSRARTMEGGASYGFSSGPYTGAGTTADGTKAYPQLGANDVPEPIKGGVQTAGRRRRGSRGSRGSRKTRKGKKPMSPWLEHVMAVKNKGGKAMSLGDAMKEAKKTYKK